MTRRKPRWRTRWRRAAVRAVPWALAVQVIPGRPTPAQPPSRLSSAAYDTASAPDRRDFRSRELWIAGVTGITTLALLPFDREIAEAVRQPSLQRRRALRECAHVLNDLGGGGVLLFGAGAYGLGRLTHREFLADIGAHTTEAIVFSGLVTGLVKGVAGRARPRLDEHDPDDFALGRGFRQPGMTSFPSGHSTAAFAAAAAITSELGHASRGKSRSLGPLFYGTAAAVGIARLYVDAHWASDVAMGAGIGTLTGLAVVHRAHGRDAEGASLSVAIAPESGAGRRESLVVIWRPGNRRSAVGAGGP